MIIWLEIMHDPTRLAVNFRFYWIYTKKAWVAVLLPVLRLGAFALPITARTSNAEAHADTYNITIGVPVVAHLQLG